MFIDLHSHILPGIDDGAASPNESRSMLETYAELGFSTVVATPHTLLDRVSNESIRSGDAESSPDMGGHVSPPLRADVRELDEASKSRGITLLCGGEIRLTPDVHTAGDLLQRSTLGDSRAVLVDFPSGSWPFYAEDALFQLQLLGYTPVLAHPERYWSDPEKIEIARNLVARGVLLQVTLGSVVGAFGKPAFTMAVHLLEAGLVHVVATDAHGIGPRLDSVARAIPWIELRYGSDALTALLAENPAAILANEEPQPVECRARGRRIFTFSGLKFLR